MSRMVLFLEADILVVNFLTKLSRSHVSMNASFVDGSEQSLTDDGPFFPILKLYSGKHAIHFIFHVGVNKFKG